jgi:prepilin-type N-terminal cleavage/methylation domain-containing protein
MVDDASRRACTRNGLTLVEVILVLALLVVIGAISVPLLEGSFSRAGLHSAGDTLRGAWAKARLAAMLSGQTCVFRFEPNGSRFQIVTLDQLGLPETSELQPDDPNAQHEAADMLRLPRSRLPDGVVFAAGDVAASSQLTATLPGATDGPWSNPILFYPDGTTSDASVLLSNSRQTTIRVTLRGLTGISNTTDLASEVPQ